MKRHILVVSSIALMGLLSVARAAETEVQTLTVQVRQTDTLTSTRGETAVSSRISSDFSTFAGSTANSDALVSGLRNGTPVTLTSTNTQGTTTATTFTPPTGKMGYGNVFISMSLAKQQLANAGITEPTNQQLQAALMGGTVTSSSGQVTQLPGVLQMRADGMGWGQIANSQGYKLGPVISGMKSTNAQVSAQPVITTAGSTRAPTSPGNSAAARLQSGIVTGAGNSVNASAGGGNGNAYGRGIVSAAGGPMGGGVVTGAGSAGNGNGNAYGRGIVTGAGNSAAAGAGGNGLAHGKNK